MTNSAADFNKGVNASIEVFFVNAVIRIISIISLIRLSLISFNKGRAIL